MKPVTPKAASNQPRTLLGFDFGRVRIGVAVGQELLKSARPLVVLQTHGQQPDWQAIQKLIQQWQPNLLVVGIPWHADGSAASLTQPALRFSRRLQGRYNLPVATIDERLSSWAAAQELANYGRPKRTTPDDAQAAALILDSWFNQSGSSKTSPDKF